MDDRKNKIYISTVVIFWIIFAFFILMVSGMYFGMYLPFSNFFVGIPVRVVLSLLGIALIVLAARARFTKISKAFFILTGSSALGIGLSIDLHNLVYALFIKLFGESFWVGMGDEPVFFILATIVCPLALLVGAIGSIILIAKKKIIF
ncbi:MAG: hypothetical protein Q8N27_03110 [Candidatus Hydromicrobium sp.]|nr:hypothetical protein [Candidatus Hydromicrobium sp.]